MRKNASDVYDKGWSPGQPTPELDLNETIILYKAYSDIKVGRWSEVAPEYQMLYEQYRSFVNEAIVEGFPPHDLKMHEMQQLFDYILQNQFIMGEAELQDFIFARKNQEAAAKARRAFRAAFGLLEPTHKKIEIY